MPFLRFSRDKRGYETTALVHTFRHQGRSNPRILYWFRTPADARVGRGALDEEAIRLLEEHHRDVSFDWPKILEVNPAVEPGEMAGRGGREAEGRQGDRRRERRKVPREFDRRAADPAAPDGLTRERDGASVQPAEVPIAAVPRAPEPASTAEPDVAAETEPLRDADNSAVQSAFSREDLVRLRGRHAALLARIDEEVTDAEKSQVLRAKAEALDPNTWVTAEDIRTALEHYEQVYRELREALGRRKRRRQPSQPSRPPDDHEPPQVV